MTSPSENRSERASTLSPRACSGDMNDTFPFTTPASVRDTRPVALTMPKSRSFTSPRAVTMTLPGEMSRWTIPSGVAVGAHQSVGVGQRLQHFVRNVKHQALAERTAVHLQLALQQARDVAADHELLGHEVLVADLAEVEHRNDVRVGQHRAQAGFVDELLDGGAAARQLRAQPLDHERALETLRPLQNGGVDVGHPAPVEATQEAVPPEHRRVGAAAAGCRAQDHRGGHARLGRGSRRLDGR